MGFLIRVARSSDSEALAALNREAMGYEYPAEATRRQLEQLLASPFHAVRVAEQNGRVVGYVHAQIYELLYAPVLADIMGLAVAASCRRQGVGRQLLAAAEEWARHIDAHGMRLVSGSERVGAHAFYEACGYASRKTQRNYKKMWD